MSSTNRGAQRLADDFYETPAWAVRALLRELGPISPSRILEPCAGRGAIVRVVHELWPGSSILANEVDESRARTCAQTMHGSLYSECYNEDFLARADWGTFDLIPTNPPFSLAVPFVEKARKHAREVAMLLRVNFVASMERADFWEKNPADLLVLPKRPSFCKSLKCGAKPKCSWKETVYLDTPTPEKCPGCGGKVDVCTTDSCEYAWCLWGPGRGGRWKRLTIEERE